MISSVDLVHYGVSRAEDWIPVDCGTKTYIPTVWAFFILPTDYVMVSSVTD